jgi:S-adenosylmethionine hydrolase
MEELTMIISFLSDFGDEDGWVASCKGVILSIAPEASFVDISHSIPSFSIRKGALVLASTLPYLPIGIHLAVIDPGVGTERRGIIGKVKRGDFLVGPDNGIFGPVIERLGGPIEVVEIKNKKYFREEICATFHGRDIFAPTAAFLFLGVKMSEFGPRIDSREIERKPWKEPQVSKDLIVGEIIDIDKFGTLRSNISSKMLGEMGFKKANLIRSEWSSEALKLSFVDTFGQVPKGERLLLIDSTGFLCLAINYGNAAQNLNAQIGDKVIIYK